MFATAGKDSLVKFWVRTGRPGDTLMGSLFEEEGDASDDFKMVFQIKAAAEVKRLLWRNSLLGEALEVVYALEVSGCSLRLAKLSN